MAETIYTIPSGPTSGQIASVTHTTDIPAYIGTGNSLDPFNNRTLYPDFPDTNTILSPRKSSFSPTVLGTTTKTYTGNLADIQTLADWGSQPQYQFSYVIEELPNQEYNITFIVPYDEITYEDIIEAEINQWEFIPNSVARNIFDAGILYIQANGTLSTYRYTVPPLLQAAIISANKNNGSLVINQQTCGTNYSQYVQWSSIANQFLALLRTGVSTIQSWTMTVRRTAVYNINNPNAYDNYNQFVISQNLASINPIISTNDLITQYGIPTNLTAFLPTSYSRMKTSTAVINGYADPVTLMVYAGWLLKHPVRTFITPTKCSITQEYIFDEWLQNAYSVSSPIGDFPLLQPTPYPTSS